MQSVYSADPADLANRFGSHNHLPRCCLYILQSLPTGPIVVGVSPIYRDAVGVFCRLQLTGPAVFKRDFISLLSFPFCSNVHIFSSWIPLVCPLNYVYSIFSSNLCFQYFVIFGGFFSVYSFVVKDFTCLCYLSAWRHC